MLSYHGGPRFVDYRHVKFHCFCIFLRFMLNSGSSCSTEAVSALYHALCSFLAMFRSFMLVLAFACFSTVRSMRPLFMHDAVLSCCSYTPFYC
jgi:hypothetical protein